VSHEIVADSRLATLYFALHRDRANGSAPRFEVVSVKPNTSNGPANSRFPLGPGDAFVPGSLFSATNQPLIAYLRFAYKLGQSDLPSLPAWVYDDRFDIEARAQGNPTKDQMRLMMQSLLTDRFKLITSTKRQSKPVFRLVLAKPGKTDLSFKRIQTMDCALLDLIGVFERCSGSNESFIFTTDHAPAQVAR
jgi:hypothetical protein